MAYLLFTYLCHNIVNNPRERTYRHINAKMDIFMNRLKGMETAEHAKRAASFIPRYLELHIL